MLNRKDIVFYLGYVTEEFISCCERKVYDGSSTEYQGQIKAYMQVLQIDGYYDNFIDIGVARKILSDIKNKKIYSYIEESF